jgi:hypothetical protein
MEPPDDDAESRRPDRDCVLVVAAVAIPAFGLAARRTVRVSDLMAVFARCELSVTFDAEVEGACLAWDAGEHRRCLIRRGYRQSIRVMSPLGVNGHLFLPIRGHHFSPLVAIVSPRWRPSNLPTIRAARV